MRLLLFALMLAGLVLSTSIPEAFGSKGLVFAGAYVFMQVGRTLFMLWALKDQSEGNYRNFQRITCWLVLSAVFWIAGGFAQGDTRLALWVVALAVEYISPTVRFWTPGLGASTTSDWDVEGGHLAERCGLFVIIALGESILVTGATFGKLPWTPAVVAAFLVGFVGSVAMWWMYFNIGAERGEQADRGIERSGEAWRGSPTPTCICCWSPASSSCAVGDELVLAHPDGHTDAKTAAVLLGGPALYLLGNLLFKRISANRFAFSHQVGLGLLAAADPGCACPEPARAQRCHHAGAGDRGDMGGAVVQLEPGPP